jgi:hypothetical protein
VNSARIYSPLDVFTDISFCYFQSNMVSLPEEENTPEKRVNKIFNLMDKVSHVVHFSSTWWSTQKRNTVTRAS